jgi:hypothetical protein
MKKTLLAILLVCGAPFAQAQIWTQTIRSAASEQFLSLAPERALAVDGAGLLFLQTRNLRVTGPASIDLHALDENGLRLTWLTSALPGSGGDPFAPQGVSARNGERVNWVDYSLGGARVPAVASYRAGETTRYRSVNFQGGITLSHAISAGSGGGFYIGRLPAAFARPLIEYWGPGMQYWSREVRGCAAGSTLPAKLLALDVDAASNTLVTVSRCLHASAPGVIAIETFDAATGSPLTTRYGWPYADSAAPVVSAQPIGDGGFVLDQYDAATGERVLRRIDVNRDGEALPLPPDYVPQPLARYSGGALVPAVDTVNRAIGAWQFNEGRTNWIEFPQLSGSDFPYVPDLPPPRLAWSGDAAGNSVVAFKLPQSDASGPVQIVAMDPNGNPLWRRKVGGYPLSQPAGNVALIGIPDTDEVVLAADEIAAPRAGETLATGVIHVERFRIDTGVTSIPWPPLHGEPPSLPSPAPID